MKDEEREVATTEALEFLRSVVADQGASTKHRLKAAAILLKSGQASYMKRQSADSN